MRLSVRLNSSWRREIEGADRRLWILRSAALRIEEHTNPLWKFEVYWKRLLLVTVVIGLVCYLAAATALWVFLQRNPDNLVGWRDVLLMPVNRANFQHKRGDTAILTGIRQFKERDFGEAFFNLRAGLGRSPGNVEGRLLMARLLASGDSARAINLLEAGVQPTGANLQLLQSLFGYYSFFQARERALAKAEELLAADGSEALPAGSREFVLRVRAGILLELNRAPEALARLEEFGPLPVDPALKQQFLSLKVGALLQMNRAADARLLLEQNSANGLSAADTLHLQAEVAIALEDTAALQSALIKMKGLAPGGPGPHFYAFRAWHRLKRTTLRDGVEREFFDAFGANDAALQSFAALLVNLDLPEVVLRVEAAARAARLSPFAFQVHLTEIALRRGEFERATRLLRNWENQVVSLQGTQKFYPEFLKLLTRAAFSGTDQSVAALASHLAGSGGQAQLSVCQLAISVLGRAKNLSGEQQVLRVALARYPLSDPLIAAKKTLDGVLASADAAKAASTAASASVQVIALPGNAAEALKQIDALLQGDALTEVRDLLRNIRASRPVWFAPQEAEFDLREVQLAFASQDLISARTRLRQFLDRNRDEATAMALVKIAGAFAKEKRPAAARVLHDELLARFSGNIRIFVALRDLALPDDLATVAADAESTLRSLDLALETSQFASAERLMDYLREKPPAWLAPVKHEMLVREVRLRLELDQQPLALAAFRPVVLQPGASRSAAFRLARETLARGKPVQAATLAAEIVRLLPDDQAAAKLLKEVLAPTPAPVGP